MYYANEVGLKSSQTPSVTESRSAEVDAPVSSAQHDALTVPLPHERIQKHISHFLLGSCLVHICCLSGISIHLIPSRREERAFSSVSPSSASMSSPVRGFFALTFARFATSIQCRLVLTLTLISKK